MQTYRTRDDAVSRAVPLAQTEDRTYYIGRIERQYCYFPGTLTYKEAWDAFGVIPDIVGTVTPSGGFEGSSGK